MKQRYDDRTDSHTPKSLYTLWLYAPKSLYTLTGSVLQRVAVCCSVRISLFLASNISQKSARLSLYALKSRYALTNKATVYTIIWHYFSYYIHSLPKSLYTLWLYALKSRYTLTNKATVYTIIGHYFSYYIHSRAPRVTAYTHYWSHCIHCHGTHPTHCIHCHCTHSTHCVPSLLNVLWGGYNW